MNLLIMNYNNSICKYYQDIRPLLINKIYVTFPYLFTHQVVANRHFIFLKCNVNKKSLIANTWIMQSSFKI